MWLNVSNKDRRRHFNAQIYEPIYEPSITVPGVVPPHAGFVVCLANAGGLG